MSVDLMNPTNPMDRFRDHGVVVEDPYFGGDDSVIIKTLIPKGVRLQGHSHPHDHLSVVLKGNPLLVLGTGPDAHQQWLREGQIINVPAGVVHTVVAVNDDIQWLCVHASKDKDPSTVEASLQAGK